MSARLVAAFCLLLSIAILWLGLRFPRPQTIDVGAPGDAYFLADFFRPEALTGADFRYGRPDAALRIPAVADGPLLLGMRLHAPGIAPPEAQRLQLIRDDQVLAAFATGTGYRRYTILLPPDRNPEPDNVTQESLVLAAPPVIPGPDDPRRLGVALDEFTIGVFPGAASVPAALARALNIAALLIVCTVLLGFRRLLLGAAITLTIASSLSVWAVLDPLGFAWAVPTPPNWLLLSLALLLVVRILWETRTDFAPRPFRAPSEQRVGAMPISIAISLTIALIAHLLLLAPPPVAGLAALLILWLPGAIATAAVFPSERDPLTRLFVWICGALSVSAMLVLALHAFPGPLSGPLLILAADILSLAGIWAILRQWHKPVAPQSPAPLSKGQPAAFRIPHSGLMLLLVLAAALRLYNLGNAEFQGDEARVMLLAAGMSDGIDTILLAHTKGPVEALLPAGPLAIVGTINEFVARLPFTLAAIGVLLGIVAIAYRVAPKFAPAAAIVAVGLLAVDGFAIGFARIVQYQSMVMLAAAGSFWCALRLLDPDEPPLPLLIGAAVMAALGLLAHYDAIMVLPALTWLVLAAGLRRRWQPGAWITHLTAPTLIGALLLASFYLPFIGDPRFASTAEYLAGRTAQGDAGGPPFNNLPLYSQILSFYNAPPLVPLLALALLAALIAIARQQLRPRWVGIVAGLSLSAAVLLQILAPEWMSSIGKASPALFIFGLPLAIMCFAPGPTPALRGLLIWFSVPFVLESFIIAEPRTHFYTLHLPAALIIGVAAGELWAAINQALARRIVATAAATVMFGAVLYVQLAYLRPFPEYQRSFPQARPNWLQASYGDELPEAGYFGFPHQDGWKAAAELFRRNQLSGSYDTNQSRLIAGWYLRDSVRCERDPDYYVIAEGEPNSYVPPGYSLRAQVSAGPATTMTIYSRDPFAGPPERIRLEDWISTFDSQPREDFAVGAAIGDVLPLNRLDLQWSTGAVLRGYDLIDSEDSARIVLYWQATQPQPNLTPVVEVRNLAGETLAEASIVCNDRPARRWAEPVLSDIPFTLPDLPPGGYSIAVGLRNESGAWIPGPAGAAPTPIATITIP
ncbi:MAG: glycosyltransferase family 39 protein [Oscillochloris sp.]|nr:glycosyltransferase family 39 protein [Oscillochloris sp.]